MNDEARIGIGALIAVGGTMVLEPGTITLFRRFGIVDRPSARSSHSAVTVRGGGLATAIACSLAWSIALPSGVDLHLLVFISVSFAALGLVDDVRHLPALFRLCLQIVFGLIALAWALEGTSGSAAQLTILGAAYVIGTVGFVNAFNFMDGINGISVAQVLVTGLNSVSIGLLRGTVTLTVVGTVLAGAALAFAPFNFPRARVFLGDSGSYFFGASGAALVIIALRASVPLEAALGPCLVYIADTVTTTAKRMSRGERWLEAHRDHTYQLLVRTGWSHTRTTLTFLAFDAVVTGLGLVSLQGMVAWRILADAGGICAGALYLSLPLYKRRAIPS